jgi:hypothetical protein
MYSKGNEQVLGKEQVLERENKTFELFCFVLILDVFRAARIYFVFHLVTSFCFFMFKIADLFLSVNVVAFSLIKTHFVFVSFCFTKPLWQCGKSKKNSSFSLGRHFIKHKKTEQLK